MNTTDRINAVLRERGIAINSLSNGSAALQRKLNRQLSEGATLTADIINIVLEAIPDLSPSWLLTGEGEMLTDAEPGLNTVPLIPISAVGGILPGDGIPGVLTDECPRVLCPEQTAEIAIDVTGESMSPAYPSGCRVFARRVSESSALRFGDVYILDTIDGAVIKRVMPGETPASITAASINPQYPPYQIPTAEIRSTWRAICRLIYQ